MAELRYNPLLDDWTMVSANRAKRPDMPKDYCPFCVTSGKVPENYDVYKYDNDFPILSTNPPVQDSVESELYSTKESYGKCDVILYSPNHEASLHELSDEHVLKLIELWTERYIELSRDSKIKYIFPFENRGAEVGVTMPHPHGQIYGYSVMPLRLKVELDNAKKHFEKTGKNLFEDMRDEEIRLQDRIVIENDSFVGFIPFFCEYPFGVYILPKEKLFSFNDFNEKHKLDLAKILKHMQRAFDTLYGKKFPYMMCIYNEPVNSPEYADSKDYFMFHIKFFPPLRAANSIKWNASSETGAWAAGNPRNVEQTSIELRRMVKMTEKLSVLEVNNMINEFEKYYGNSNEATLFFSPSRINIIGEHIDYNGGKVLPCSIDIGTYALVRATDDRKINLHSLNREYSEKLCIDNPIYDETKDWLNYPLGMILSMSEFGSNIGGFEGIVYGNIPNGSGLSSSASLELLIGKIINDFYNDNSIDSLDIVKLGKVTENKFIGVNSGIMDQFAIGMGKEDNAVLLNTATLEYSYIPVILDGYSIVIMNTNKRRELKDSKYNERRSECEKALEFVNQFVKCNDLCDLSDEEYIEVLDKFEEGNIKNRFIHVVTENNRVKDAVVALKNQNIEELGQLLNKSHISLRDNYDVTGVELDTLFEASLKFGAIGARMTGAGFGGCAIAIVKVNEIEEFKANVAQTYLEKTGLVCEFFISKAAGGPIKIS